MEAPCKTCKTRNLYARAFDMQIWGEDCPYECDEYKQWKAEQTEDWSHDATD